MKYVVGFLFSSDLDRVVLIRKSKPTWQKGRLNGVGGKIEEGESANDAMSREFYEETGLFTSPGLWGHYATMKGDPLKGEDWCVYVFAMMGNVDGVKTITDEPVGIYSINVLCLEVMIENLNWLIHLAVDHLSDGRPKFTEVTYV